ncbi:Colicin I receptor precursor [Mariniflexile rhizosphaerae]|uniref:SusC/RagA family TonB-linked outer membrane protein n=1 Tax=unclassified Mariniflexile TaxID=2643887 RepID=UPI000CBFEF39|nr:SusC/RagA family TonB-linked outer membrane protein [Mariniflexile sp. TRM1-10]AXP79599.1 Colicin I receptor precursor [Mariniflexile sp. TRM1-10]PLB18566.1 MAG: TonB-linked outer membrane protein, SusC/RagA family [Flavobacteriaceae bacterium FS1-H7996/R]
MKTKFSGILTLLLAFVVQLTFAQEKTVSGTISDASGLPLPGATVLVKGTTTGTSSDFDGNYSIKANQGATLVFSFVGYTTKEVNVGASNTINVTLSEDAQALEEVVVTAFGSDRNAKQVVYANQTVKSEDLLSTPTKNALEGLRGKTAGVRLSTASGSVGASTRIVLRGEGSLTGNNNALIVIDGVAIDNTSTSGGAGSSTTGYSDFGNRFNDVNPDDIESVTILKGPSATSLYGSRGASGVVLITTKTGKGKKMQINYNGSTSMETAIINLQRQSKFGQGYDTAHLDSGENWSWGPALDGVVRPWTSPIDSDGDGSLEALIRPYSAVRNQLKDFFNTGYTTTNNINISGANEAFTYYASYGSTDQSGTLDNTYYKRNNITFNASAKLSDKLKSDFKVSYANVKQNTVQEGSRAFEGNNAYAMAVQSPVNIPFTELRDYKSPFHDINGYWGSYSSVNPYYILNEYGNEGNIDNILANASLTYNFLENLSITGRFGGNIVNTQTDIWTPTFTPAQQLVWTDDLQIATRNSKHSSLGEYINSNTKVENLDATVMANYNTEFSENLTLTAAAGYNFFQKSSERLTGSSVGGLVVPDVYNLANSVQNPTSEMYRSKYRIFGVLGNATLGYKNAAFLEFSARNDWSSTLPTENNSFLYGAVGASLVLTDLFDIKNDVINYAKLRGSYGTSGKDAGLYLLNSYFVGNPQIVELGDYDLTFPKDGVPGFTIGNTIGNPTLKPELTTTYEVGTDLGLFNNKVSVAYTYYHSIHDDQIVEISLPRSTGYTTTASNIGRMENKGHELTLTLKPLNGVVEGLDFELFGSYSTNDNKVVKVTDEIDELSIGTYGFAAGTTVSLVAKEGLPFGTFKGNDFTYNAQGQTIVDATGLPVKTSEDVFLGSYQPDYLLNFGTNIKYKGFGIRILLDMKKGGLFASQTKYNTNFNGTNVNTTVYNREPFIFPNSVVDNGDGTFSENTVQITEQVYFTDYDAPVSTQLIDASYLKLREVELSYTFSKEILKNTFFTNARISLYGKNLMYWLPDENKYADPEVNGITAATNNSGSSTTGNGQGIETTQTPSSRSLGLNLQLSF